METSNPTKRNTPSALDLSSILLIASIEDTYRKAIKGDPDKFGRLQKVEIGDLVMETSSLFLLCRDFSRFGLLVATERDAYGTASYRIQLLDGDLMWWSNCAFINVSSLFDGHRLDAVKQALTGMRLKPKRKRRGNED